MYDGFFAEITRPLLLYILIFGAALLLTLLIETPIIVRGRVTDNRTYIRGVNTVTNVLLNLTLLMLQFLKDYAADEAAIEIISLIWFILAELLLIPVSEGLLYLKLSLAGKKRVFLVTYLANLTSCGAGLILSVIIHRWV